MFCKTIVLMLLSYKPPMQRPILCLQHLICKVCIADFGDSQLSGQEQYPDQRGQWTSADQYPPSDTLCTRLGPRSQIRCMSLARVLDAMQVAYCLQHMFDMPAAIAEVGTCLHRFKACTLILHYLIP